MQKYGLFEVVQMKRALFCVLQWRFNTFLRFCQLYFPLIVGSVQ